MCEIGQVPCEQDTQRQSSIHCETSALVNYFKVFCLVGKQNLGSLNVCLPKETCDMGKLKEKATKLLRKTQQNKFMKQEKEV